MDTSKQYIEMCSKATEIQELYNGNYRPHDYTVDDISCKAQEDLFNGEITVDEFINISYTPHKDIWLPKQDQLQEMIEGDYDNRISLHTEFGLHLYDSRWTYGDKFRHGYENYKDSSEQLWLAFVMKEKYNKQYNFTSKEWEEIK